MKLRSVRTRTLLASFFAFTFLTLLLPNAFGQGTKRKSQYDPIEEVDRPDKRAEWMMRGRTAPAGQSAAALRLKALKQKMAMRAQRAAQAAAVQGAAPPPSSGWVSLGPAPLVSDGNVFGFVSGRATSAAIDPSDTTGNTVYLGGAYGGVWKSTNAANGVASNVVWTPVTDQEASLATGAVSVKPDGSVVLVGTGEPNNAIDSYYGVGILRSSDKGGSWSLIQTADGGAHSFAGVGFTKFAWSTATPNTVMAAAATAFKGVQEGKVNGNSLRGLYLSTDAGQTWAFQALTDGSTPISATDVVYNAGAGKFYAAVRYLGLYSSSNGTSWTRLASQPTPITTTSCPVTELQSCPMYRGQLAVVSGRNEMYFWFTDINDNDQGIWQSTDGGSTWKAVNENGIANCGDSFGCGTQQAFYNLEISAVPNGSATDLYAGAVNLFKCKLASGATSCSTLDSNLPNQWINLTHVYGCSNKANVHPDEHGLDFIISGGKDIMYFANDGGVYRALDGYTGLNVGSCNNAANNQFDNLNETIGSMTQFVSFSINPTDQNTILGGTQDNGSPATSTGTTSTQWFTANGGDGGFNAINPSNTSQWFTANTDVSIQVCNVAPGCNSGNFFPVVGNGQVGGDFGPFYTPYILDPQNANEVLVGTCRVWRGSTVGTGFSKLSADFDNGSNSAICTGGEVNQVHALAAGGPLSGGFSNVVYATTEGYGPNIPTNPAGGEVWATTNAATTAMSNVTGTINTSHYPISAVAIDNSDATGKTAFVGIMGFGVSHIFKTTNAGGSWSDWTGTLPDAPVNSLLVDSANHLVYAGTDVGVFVSPTTPAASWTEVGPAPGGGVAGYLPNVPVSAVRLFNSGGTTKLRVSTYGRGVWEFNLNTTPDFSWTGGGSHTVLSGQTTPAYSFTATSSGATFASTITFSCQNLPALTTCIFNPTSISAGTPGAQGVPVSLTITSTGPNTGTGNRNRRADNRRPRLPLTLPLAGVVLAGLAGRKLPKRYSVAGLLLLLAMTGLLLACGGGGGGSPPPPPITVTVSAGNPSSIFPNNTGWQTTQTAQFTAAVSNTNNTAVTWSVVGGNANGTIDANGLYTAPTVAPGLPPTATITATSVADPTKSGSSNETLNPATLPGSYSNIGVKAADSGLTLTNTVTLTVQ